MAMAAAVVAVRVAEEAAAATAVLAALAVGVACILAEAAAVPGHSPGT